ncbi:signal peptidase II, partial [gut metagenome]
MLYAIVALLVIIADQWVKYWVSMSISMASTGEPLIPGIVSLVNLHNDGCAFSFLSGGGARIYFIVLTGIFTVAV